jgi:hypothetical protein
MRSALLCDQQDGRKARKIRAFPAPPLQSTQPSPRLGVRVLPMNNPSILPSAIAAAAIALTSLLSTGCSNRIERDMMAEAVTAGERPVAMRGESSWFEGKLGATATVSRGFERVGKDGSTGKVGPRNNKGDDLDTGRRRKDSDGITEVYSTGFGDSEEDQKEAMKEYYRMAMARRAQGSPMPPVTLRVQFENRGSEPIEVGISEVNSELGNFAVRPEKLTIAPGEKGALEPMVSQLGVTSDDIPVRISIRVGGKKETQIVSVKNIILPSVLKK